MKTILSALITFVTGSTTRKTLFAVFISILVGHLGTVLYAKKVRDRANDQGDDLYPKSLENNRESHEKHADKLIKKYAD